jgi:hypothetical protein
MTDKNKNSASELEAGFNSTQKKAAKTKEKFIKGIFLVSPTARFKLGYSAGEEGSLPELQAIELEEAGYFKFTK